MAQSSTTTATTTRTSSDLSTTDIESIVLLLSPIAAAGRAVWVLLEEARALGAPSTNNVLERMRIVEVNMLRGDHINTPEYTAINPTKTVPTLIHGSLVLTEPCVSQRSIEVDIRL